MIKLAEEGGVVGSSVDVWSGPGAVLPVVGAATVTDVHAVRPADLKELVAIPVSPVAMLEAEAVVVTTVNATTTLDCRRWRPDDALTPVMTMLDAETPVNAEATAILNWVACAVPNVISV